MLIISIHLSIISFHKLERNIFDTRNGGLRSEYPIVIQMLFEAVEWRTNCVPNCNPKIMVHNLFL